MNTISKKIAIASVAGASLMAAGNTAAIEGDVGIHFADFDTLNSGGGLHGHVDFMENYRVRADFTSVEFLNQVGWSGAYVLDMDPMEMEFGALYQFWDFEGPLEDDAYGAYGRFDYSVMDGLGFYGQLKFLSFKNLEDSDTVVGLGGDYAITDQFGVNLGIDMYTNDDLWGDETPMFIRLGASYRF